MLLHLLFLFNYNMALLGVISPHLFLPRLREILKYLKKKRRIKRYIKKTLTVLYKSHCCILYGIIFLNWIIELFTQVKIHLLYAYLYRLTKWIPARGALTYWTWELVGKICVYANTALNPLIYTGFNSRYRQAYLETFTPKCLIGKKQKRDRVDRRGLDVETEHYIYAANSVKTR